MRGTEVKEVQKVYLEKKETMYIDSNFLFHFISSFVQILGNNHNGIGENGSSGCMGTQGANGQKVL